jgi:hypothetical protein
VEKSLGYHWNRTIHHLNDSVLTRTTQNEEDKHVQVKIPLTINSTGTGKILVNTTGLGGSKDGEDGIFKKVAELLQGKDVASVVRYQSSLFDFAFKKIDMEALLLDNLRATLDYCLSQAQAICGSNAPEVFLAGYSAGASTSAAIVFEYQQVS